jgi:NAD(P)-dependent dehydrogenase (short-subunit alcohol dehydrogenase family)
VLSGIGAYNNSKLAIVLFTYELARRPEGTGVTANCVHPAWCATPPRGAESGFRCRSGSPGRCSAR